MSHAVDDENYLDIEAALEHGGVTTTPEVNAWKAQIRRRLHILCWALLNLTIWEVEQRILQLARPRALRQRRRAAPIIQYERLFSGQWRTWRQRSLWWRQYVWHDVARIVENNRGHRLPPYFEAPRHMQAMLDATATAIEERRAST